MLEAQGLKVHVYTSPHLVRFRERIRIAGELICEDELAATLEECERVNDGAPITFFEITTAAAFLAFSRHPADALVLEVGLGGKYDATNVIAKPRMTIITPVGLDHQEFLGERRSPDIAAEKAGIIKPGVPLIVGPQEDARARRDPAPRRRAHARRPIVFGQDFFAHQEHGRMVYQDDGRPARPAAAQAHRPPPDRECGGRHRRACAAPARDWGDGRGDRAGPAHRRMAGAAAAPDARAR